MSSPTSGGSAAAEEEDSSSSSSITSPPSPLDARTQTNTVEMANVSTALGSMPNDFRAALDEFRDNWQRELLNTEHKQSHEESTHLDHSKSNNCDIDEQQQALAESLFHKAVQLEQRGKVYDALPFYRKAVQIVPDIEFKFYERNKLGLGPAAANEADATATRALHNTSRRASDAELNANLYEQFQMDLAQDYGGKLLLNTRCASVIATELQISDLPPEIIFYILRWVVSSQLDMRSLEQCAAVCRGFYLCARDEDLWRLACIKVWGANVGTISGVTNVSPTSTKNTQTNEPQPAIYSSWRQMFIERERVHFNGCYISKTTYLRMGENSFQDQYYRPVQLVEYFRYVRFLPDGTVLMMTNADEPVQGVNKLKHLQQLRQDVLRGHYRLLGNTVTIVLKKPKRQSNAYAQQYMTRPRRGSLAVGDEPGRTTYCIEFRIMKTNKRRFNHLVWLNYSIKQVRNKVEASSDFDITPSKYPPLWFSPVRSYHLDADAPLA